MPTKLELKLAEKLSGFMFCAIRSSLPCGQVITLGARLLIKWAKRMKDLLCQALEKPGAITPRSWKRRYARILAAAKKEPPFYACDSQTWITRVRRKAAC